MTPLTRELDARREAEKRHIAEEALRASERDFRTFFEMVGVGNVIADARSGLFLRVNRHFCEITGYCEAELRGMTADELTHADDLERDRAGWAAAKHERGSSFTIEKRYLRKDGAVVWVQVTSTLVRNASAEPLHAIGVVLDVTDRRRATDELAWTRRALGQTGPFLQDEEEERIARQQHECLRRDLIEAASAANALATKLGPDSPAAREAERLARLIVTAARNSLLTRGAAILPDDFGTISPASRAQS